MSDLKKLQNQYYSQKYQASKANQEWHLTFDEWHEYGQRVTTTQKLLARTDGTKISRLREDLPWQKGNLCIVPKFGRNISRSAGTAQAAHIPRKLTLAQWVSELRAR